MKTSCPLPQPSARRLRVYAFDPNASLDLGSAKFSHATISLPWNDSTDEGELEPGPVNEYLEVIDFDPCSQQFYEPVDLSAAEVLGQDGLRPSEGDPRFHQQMVFAVTMKTIKLFERALGRKIIWRPEWDNRNQTYIPTKKLRIYPHALREANAYYSPGKRAILFGYFKCTRRNVGANWIFTALSHDIIVHETTHAILDGLHLRYSEATSTDSLAFHEAFADIAALFSHFQLYEAVYDFIEGSGGRLDQSGLLSQLAGQFAKGSTGRSALRDYIDKTPNPDLIEHATEAHDRGAILVAAVFDAFLSIYTARTEDLLRLGDTRLGTSQHLHPDLVGRLTKEATKSANHVLRMCIRALDYLPPVDMRLSDFLRAVITADAELIPDDRLNYRLAFVEAFRHRGIFPEKCLSLSPDSLSWDPPTNLQADDILESGLELQPMFRRADITDISERNRRRVWYWLTQPQIRIKDPQPLDDRALRNLMSQARIHFSNQPEAADEPGRQAARITADQLVDTIATELRRFLSKGYIRQLRKRLACADTYSAQWRTFLEVLLNDSSRLVADNTADEAWETALGIYFKRPAIRAQKSSPLYSIRSDAFGFKVEVHSVRTTRRTGPDGLGTRQLVIEVTQGRRGFLSPEKQTSVDNDAENEERGDFVFRGGATIIIDIRAGAELRHIIRKQVDDEERLREQREFLTDAESLGFAHKPAKNMEPFALVHRS